MKRLLRVLLLTLIWLGGLHQPAWGNTSQSYQFTVFLGEKEIGRQRFDVSSEGEQTHVRVDAQFEVKFFLITFYTYRHTNIEKWESDCLREIRSHTEDNGDAYFVNGIFQNGQLQVQTQTGDWSSDECIKTFAYWDPKWVTGERLLNSQTGELLPVSIRAMGEETISVQGIPTQTTRRRIIANEFTVDLWYAKNGRWVALQSTTKKGELLRYVLERGLDQFIDKQSNAVWGAPQLGLDQVERRNGRKSRTPRGVVTRAPERICRKGRLRHPHTTRREISVEEKIRIEIES